MTEIKNFPECEKLTNKFILLRENVVKFMIIDRKKS